MPFKNHEMSARGEDLQALRALIEEIASRYSIDLSQRAVITAIMDRNAEVIEGNTMPRQLFDDFSSMLRLLYRLECSSSEDTGVSGICRLWERHKEFLLRFRAYRRSPRTVPAASC